MPTPPPTALLRYRGQRFEAVLYHNHLIHLAILFITLVTFTHISHIQSTTRSFSLDCTLPLRSFPSFSFPPSTMSAVKAKVAVIYYSTWGHRQHT